MTSGRRNKGNGDDPPRRHGKRALIDRLLIALYAVVAAAIVIGLILFVLWGALRE